jgi:hypothetical protein
MSHLQNLEIPASSIGNTGIRIRKDSVVRKLNTNLYSGTNGAHYNWIYLCWKDCLLYFIHHWNMTNEIKCEQEVICWIRDSNESIKYGSSLSYTSMYWVITNHESSISDMNWKASHRKQVRQSFIYREISVNYYYFSWKAFNKGEMPSWRCI